MGHRAIVAYRRPDDRYNLHYSHWGAAGLELKHQITAATPLGGDENEPEFLTAFNSMLDEAVGDDVEIEGRAVEAGPNTAVDPDPFATNLPMSEVVEEICHVMHEAFYVVTGFEDPEPADDNVEVHAFRTLYVPFCDESEGVDESAPGLLVEPRWHDGEPVSDGRDRGWYRGVRDTLEGFVDEGVITEEEARDRLIDAILEKFDDSLNKRVFAYSPLLNESHWEENPCAFVRPTGRTRVLGGMYPTGYDEDSLESWMIPAGFDVPDPVSR